ncbi:hypothetical protein GQ55_3G095600 [Panicum hallii var. hallii]|uniref:Uncharacterized protein n=1 Tax=Panicum hallii var. hallii TaxID=1504633 RepID=A0A2T7E7L2_9POAL|nr:hypothetical protein GQ55_3G095600 [Panicum hallii var. hallii]
MLPCHPLLRRTGEPHTTNQRSAADRRAVSVAPPIGMSPASRLLALVPNSRSGGSAEDHRLWMHWRLALPLASGGSCGGRRRRRRTCLTKGERGLICKITWSFI